MRLRPTMRENFRYILVRIIPETSVFESLELYRAVSDAVETLFGDTESARIWPSIMIVSGCHAIIRCRRGKEMYLETALATVTHIQNRGAAVHPICTSGTIRTLREKIPGDMQIRPGAVMIGGTTCDAFFLRGGRIDLKEKGIYHDIPRYITEEDIEDHKP